MSRGDSRAGASALSRIRSGVVWTPPTLKIGSTHIDDTFAEAFGMRYTRIIVTAHDAFWLEAAIREVTGYASSVISCDAEAGLERHLESVQTPDGRPGASILFFGFSAEPLGKAVANRVGQCLMTCATTAVFDGLESSQTRVPLGRHLRFFGDGFQKAKVIGPRRYWRVPVMDGEFLVIDDIGIERGVAGGNFIIESRGLEAGLVAARAAVDSIAELPGVITPFPAGVVRSGSKVGSRYSRLRASTNDSFCPTLRGRTATRLHPDADCAYEIVMNGIDEATVRGAMGIAIRAAVGPDVVQVSAGNYGGNLGKYRLALHEVLS